jgi:hypothetical protein
MPQIKRRSKTQKSSVGNRMKRKVHTDQTAMVILRRTRTKIMVFINFVGSTATQIPQMKRRRTPGQGFLDHQMNRKIRNLPRNQRPILILQRMSQVKRITMSHIEMRTILLTPGPLFHLQRLIRVAKWCRAEVPGSSC